MTWSRQFETNDSIPVSVDKTRRKKRRRKKLDDDDQELTKEDTGWFSPEKHDVYPTGARRRVHNPQRTRFDVQDITRHIASQLLVLAEAVLEDK